MCLSYELDMLPPCRARSPDHSSELKWKRLTESTGTAAFQTVGGHITGKRPSVNAQNAKLRLFLARRAEERRAPRLHDTLDGPSAAGIGTSLAFAIIDPERMLEIAQRAIRLDMVAQRGSPATMASAITSRTHSARSPAAALPCPSCQRAFRPHAWRETRAVERLADIDVAEPGNHCLVEKSRLQRRLLVRKCRRQHLGTQAVAGRLRPEARQIGIVVKTRRLLKQEKAEAPGSLYMIRAGSFPRAR